MTGLCLTNIQHTAKALLKYFDQLKGSTIKILELRNTRKPG